MIVVGCQSITSGSASLDSADVPLYRASTSSSIEASVSSSAARESERQESVAKEAVHTSCEALSSSSVDAIAAVNGYVDAVNENSMDLVAKAGPAVDALNRTADVVAGSISDPLAPDLRDALTAWVDAARALASAIAADAQTSEFNSAIDRVNDSQGVALNLCDAAY
ncbi:hypothetical protein [Mycolicibacterium sediminis]|nr:hypothetical protein [Mycolicibacterium sediminis]